MKGRVSKDCNVVCFCNYRRSPTTNTLNSNCQMSLTWLEFLNAWKQAKQFHADHHTPNPLLFSQHFHQLLPSVYHSSTQETIYSGLLTYQPVGLWDYGGKPMQSQAKSANATQTHWRSELNLGHWGQRQWFI